LARVSLAIGVFLKLCARRRNFRDTFLCFS
jgi:hypothetical protein